MNFLELRAIQLGLQHFLEELQGKTVVLCYLCLDNTTALAHMHPKSVRHSLQTANIFAQGDSAVEQGQLCTLGTEVHPGREESRGVDVILDSM